MRALLEEHRAEASRRTLQVRLADTITRFTGSMGFVWFHVIWFGAWIALNVVPAGVRFDPFPFGLMTTIVSLEAIFLSAFVLISQNRMQAVADRRAELDLHINLLAEREATVLLSKLVRIERHLGIAVPAGEARLTADLQQPTSPVDVLLEIERNE
jgi:uncharacterized membrane protein